MHRTRRRRRADAEEVRRKKHRAAAAERAKLDFAAGPGIEHREVRAARSAVANPGALDVGVVAVADVAGLLRRRGRVLQRDRGADRCDMDGVCRRERSDSDFAEVIDEERIDRAAIGGVERVAVDALHFERIGRGRYGLSRAQRRVRPAIAIRGRAVAAHEHLQKARVAVERGPKVERNRKQPIDDIHGVQADRSADLSSARRRGEELKSQIVQAGHRCVRLFEATLVRECARLRKRLRRKSE